MDKLHKLDMIIGFVLTNGYPEVKEAAQSIHEELAEALKPSHNKQSTPLICVCGSKKSSMVSYECPDCHGEVTN